MPTIPPTRPGIRPPLLGLHLGLGIVAGLAVGVAFLARSEPVYAATTSVLVESLGSDVNMSTEAELVGATQTTTDAFARLTGDPAQPPQAGRLADVSPVPGTSVLRITFESGSAAIAQAGATAFAEAYLAARAAAAQAAIDAELAATEQRLAEVQAQLGGITALIDELPPEAAELGSLRASQETLVSEAGELTTRLHELRSSAVDPGRIIDQAPLPGAPVRPDRPSVLGLAVAAGALGGVVLHLLRTRWSRRVRRVADLRRHRLPVLAEGAPLQAEGGRGGLSAGHYDRLRNEIVAALSPDDHVVLVTSAAPGPAGVLVAAELAAAFARADSDVVLVGASVAPPGSTLAGRFDVADIPGFTDVLAGRTTLPRAVQRAARQPQLRVITPGGAGGAAGLLQSAGARSVLRQLATRIRYVIVDAPSTAVGADAQSLAGGCDVAILVVELGRTEHAQIADAANQLARVGIRLVGAVVVPRVTTVDEPGPAPGTRRAVGEATYDTEGWIGDRTAAVDEPTTKLGTLPRWPLSRERPTPRTQPRSGTPG